MKLTALDSAVRALAAERDGLVRTIRFVLADAESQHPDGWGPDITMVDVLKRALKGEYPAMKDI